MAELKVISCWRMTAAEPSGMHMWFDPFTETPQLLDSPSPDGDESEGYYEGGALDGTLRGEGVVPCEGDAASTVNTKDPELPF